eukprot:s2072_g8.t1
MVRLTEVQHGLPRSFVISIHNLLLTSLDGLLMAGSSMLHQFSIMSACATIGLHVQEFILHNSGTYE